MQASAMSVVGQLVSSASGSTSKASSCGAPYPDADDGHGPVEAHPRQIRRRAALISAIERAVPPMVAQRPFPEGRVPLRSQEGLQLLEGSVGPAFEKVAAGFLAQGPMQCGVTSLAMALNVCKRRDEPAFTIGKLHDELRAALRVQSRFFSASLGELGALARRYASARTVYASGCTCNSFRARAAETLEAGGCVVANFQRAALGYNSPFSGHCSPLVAYNAGADEFLVMDVAQKSWQPVWVPTEAIFRGMRTLEKPRDESVPATHSRGFILFDPAGAPPAVDA